MFSRKFDRRVHLFLVVVMCAFVVGATFGFYALWPANVETDYQPAQPIAFSHALHAGSGRLPDGRDGMAIPCLYCHSGAETGAHATVPTVATCMKCHTEVQTQVTKIVGTHVNEAGELEKETMLHEEIAKLLEYHEQQKSIRWVKVNDLADFVYFEHSRHISAGLDCVECHGPVEKMDVVKRMYSLKMAWCLDCHRQEPTEVTSDVYKRENLRGPINCSACHR